MDEDVPDDAYDGVGLLTETQRRYLDGVSDVEAGSQRERTLRSRFRERVVGGIRDLFFLSMRDIDGRDISQISEKIEIPQANVSRILSFILQIYYDRMHYSIDERPEWIADDMESIINRTLVNLYNKKGIDIESASVDVDIDMEVGEMIELPDDKQKIDDLTDREIGILWRSGQISWEEYASMSDIVQDNSIDDS